MKKLVITLAVTIFLVTACTNPSGQVTQVAPEPALATSEPTAITLNPTVPVESQPAAAAVVYKIVPGESSASYEVGETFLNQNNRFNVAIGNTVQITGDVTVDTANPQNSQIGRIEIDISQLQSDSSRRDNALRDRFLESNSYPTAVFTPTKITGLPASYTTGEPLTFQVTGDLTVKETTQEVTFDVAAQIEGSDLVGTATTTVLLSEFGIGPIEIGGVLKTEDQAKLTLSFVARP